MDNKKIIILTNAKDRPVNPELVSFLELQLARAKEGKIMCFSCVEFTTVEGAFCERFLLIPHRMRWSDHLAFTECMEKEKIRFRAITDNKFGD